MWLEFLWISATILTFATLMFAGHRHLRNEGFLSTALHARFGMGGLACGRLARLIGFYELALGSTGLTSAVLAPRAFLRILMGVALVTYMVYAWYVSSLLSRGMSVPCGCTSDDVPANSGSVARTLFLALAAAFALLAWVDARAVQAAPVVMLLMSALAGATFTTLLWNLPSALAGLPPKAAGGRASPRLPPKAAGGRASSRVAAEGGGGRAYFRIDR